MFQPVFYILICFIFALNLTFAKSGECQPCSYMEDVLNYSDRVTSGQQYTCADWDSTLSEDEVKEIFKCSQEICKQVELSKRIKSIDDSELFEFCYHAHHDPSDEIEEEFREDPLLFEWFCGELPDFFKTPEAKKIRELLENILETNLKANATLQDFVKRIAFREKNDFSNFKPADLLILNFSYSAVALKSSCLKLILSKEGASACFDEIFNINSKEKEELIDFYTSLIENYPKVSNLPRTILQAKYPLLSYLDAIKKLQNEIKAKDAKLISVLGESSIPDEIFSKNYNVPAESLSEEDILELIELNYFNDIMLSHLKKHPETFLAKSSTFIKQKLGNLRVHEKYGDKSFQEFFREMDEYVGGDYFLNLFYFKSIVSQRAGDILRLLSNLIQRLPDKSQIKEFEDSIEGVTKKILSSLSSEFSIDSLNDIQDHLLKDVKYECSFKAPKDHIEDVKKFLLGQQNLSLTRKEMIDNSDNLASEVLGASQLMHLALGKNLIDFEILESGLGLSEEENHYNHYGNGKVIRISASTVRTFEAGTGPGLYVLAHEIAHAIDYAFKSLKLSPLSSKVSKEIKSCLDGNHIEELDEQGNKRRIVNFNDMNSDYEQGHYATEDFADYVAGKAYPKESLQWKCQSIKVYGDNYIDTFDLHDFESTYEKFFLPTDHTTREGKPETHSSYFFRLWYMALINGHKIPKSCQMIALLQ